MNVFISNQDSATNVCVHVLLSVLYMYTYMHLVRVTFNASVSLPQVMPSQITNPGDAEEKRYTCHRVDRVTLDFAHHCLAPKHYSSTPRYPQGYVVHNSTGNVKCEADP